MRGEREGVRKGRGGKGWGREGRGEEGREGVRKGRGGKG